VSIRLVERMRKCWFSRMIALKSGSNRFGEAQMESSALHDRFPID